MLGWVVAGALIASGPAEATQRVWREESEKTVDGRGIRTVEITNARGRVDLTPSGDGKIHVTALKIVRSSDPERARAMARGITVQTETEGDRFTVEVLYQKRHTIKIGFWDIFKVDGVSYPRYEVRIACQVPPGVAVSVRETSGDVLSDGIAGAQVLRSTSGDVEVRSPGARIEASSTSGDVTASDLRDATVRTVSGDIVVRDVSGPLRAQSTSGRITVTGAADSLALNSVSGDIRAEGTPRGLEAGTTSGEVTVRGLSGRVKVSSTSGDVRIGVRGPLHGLDASSSSGSIRLQLDPSIACALDMRTSSGTLEASLPMEMRTATRRNVAGTIRGGRTPVVLHTTSGDITVAGGGQ
jgi:hypothetical protein